MVDDVVIVVIMTFFFFLLNLKLSVQGRFHRSYIIFNRPELLDRLVHTPIFKDQGAIKHRDERLVVLTLGFFYGFAFVLLEVFLLLDLLIRAYLSWRVKRSVILSQVFHVAEDQV